MALSGNSTRLATGSEDATAILWDIQNGKWGAVMKGHTSFIGSVTFNNDGTRLASGSEDGTVRLWDTKTGAALRVLTSEIPVVRDMVFNPETLMRLRAEVGPVVGCNFDPSHLFWQQIDPLEAIRALGRLICHVHAKDTRTQEHAVRVNGVLDPKPGVVSVPAAPQPMHTPSRAAQAALRHP